MKKRLLLTRRFGVMAAFAVWICKFASRMSLSDPLPVSSRYFVVRLHFIQLIHSNVSSLNIK
jgi:hypothetical protein